MINSFSHLIHSIYTDRKQRLFTKIDQLCWRARFIQRSITQISRRALAYLIICLRAQCDYLFGCQSSDLSDQKSSADQRDSGVKTKEVVNPFAPSPFIRAGSGLTSHSTKVSLSNAHQLFFKDPALNHSLARKATAISPTFPPVEAVSGGVENSPLERRSNHMSSGRAVSSSTIYSLPDDVLGKILVDSSDGSVSHSSKACKSLYAIHRRSITTYRSRNLPARLPRDCPNLHSICLLVDTKIKAEQFGVLLNFKLLRNLDLARVVSVNDEALAILRNLETLDVLNLANCNGFSNEGLRGFKQSPLEKTLRYLDLSQCSQISDEGIEFLGHGILNGLNLQHCNQIVGLGLKAFAEKESSDLRSLNLNYNQNLHEHHAICSFNSLKKLCLASTNADGKIVKKICAKLRHLTHLDLSFCKEIAHGDFKDLRALSHLKSLMLASCRVRNETVIGLSELKNLEELDLSNCQLITDKCCETLVQLEALKDLYLIGCSNVLVNEISITLKTLQRDKNNPKLHFLFTQPAILESVSTQIPNQHMTEAKYELRVAAL